MTDLEAVIYGALMHHSKPKTVSDFERAARTVAEMLERRQSDELERLRAQVASLSREAWTWSKALEAQLAAQVAPASTSTHSALDVLRELREWDHRGDTVQEHWDEIYGPGAFDAVLNAAQAQQAGQAPAPAPETSSPARPFSAVKSFADSVLAMLDERIKAVDQASHPFNDYFGDKPETIVAAKAQAGELREVRTQVRILADRTLVELMKFRPAISAPAVVAGRLTPKAIEGEFASWCRSKGMTADRCDNANIWIRYAFEAGVALASKPPVQPKEPTHD